MTMCVQVIGPASQGEGALPVHAIKAKGTDLRPRGKTRLVGERKMSLCFVLVW